MRNLLIVMLCGAASLWAQSDRGTVTGTVSDPVGAVVANAAVEARNTQTGVTTSVASSATGNFTIPGLPAGDYEITLTVPGFKKYTRQNLTVDAAQTIRVDVTLEVGNTSDSITVTEAAPLLKTESGELSHVVSTERMNNMPGLQTSSVSGSAGIRNPITVVALIPGSALAPGQTGPTVRINGGVSNSQTMLVEGMDASNSLGQGASQQNQVGVDSVQEFAIQTSNYAAEFGQAGSAIMNITMKSGTNSYHGSLYEYWTHEKLFAGQPLLNPQNFSATRLADGNPRPKTRRNDYGFTIGGPVWIPKVYNGRNKTFFFVNWEQFRVGGNIIPDALSVPTADYRQGNFSGALLSNQVGTDALLRPIFPNMIYDPTTRRTVTCQTGATTCSAGSQVVITDPFTNNTIPQARLDSVALKVQAFIPNATNPGLLVNNYQGSYVQERVTGVPSFKIDQVINSNNKLSFTFNRTRTQCDYCAGAEGFPAAITAAIGTDVRAHTERLNWDTIISPTVLLHWGIGWTQNWLGRPALFDNYDALGGLGLRTPAGAAGRTFPNFTGLSNTQSGGSSNISSTGALADDVFQQGTAIVSLSWVKDNHTFKFGGELRNQGDYRLDASTINGQYAFSQVQTAMPYIVAANSQAQVGGNATGFNYASFLLGLVNSGNIKPGSRARIGKQQWGFYAQDTWKVTRKLTLDYGLRYDYSTYLQESYGRMATFSPDVVHTRAGGILGGTAYEATCKCNFANNYKFGFGPRLGVAYQITPKTVFRGGFGIVYTGTPQYNLAGPALSAQNPFGPNADPGREVMTLAGGVPLTAQQIAWPNFDPSFYPLNALVGAGPNFVVDQNSGRPGRQVQWSIGLQRQITSNLLVEASYIGNRQVWLTAANLLNYNFISQDRLTAAGLSLSNPADLTILQANIASAAAGRFQNRLPFPGFNGTVAQSLRPYPQFNGGMTAFWAPVGNAWYDSLQTKVTQRFSHGLDFTYTFTWSKELDTLSVGSGTVTGPGDVSNRQNLKSISANSRPLISGLGLNYTVQNYVKQKYLAPIVRGWQFGTFLQYASGLPFAPPAATQTPSLNNLVFQGTSMVRVPGQPLFNVDLNCHCFDPNTTFVLNPKAWTNPAPGQFGSGTYYDDFRQQRHPLETLSIGRTFRLKEKVNLAVRAEWTNIFNRAFINNPTATNPLAPQNRLGGSTASNAQTIAGYGFINNAVLNQGTFAVAGGAPRSGQLVARLTF
ncbi:MAG TPA: TonB-dependent receptor [Bryobacteraceae bacterium]|nr:TonB-dependent receptor [Bryobacteraceae bacterium]